MHHVAYFGHIKRVQYDGKGNDVHVRTINSCHHYVFGVVSHTLSSFLHTCNIDATYTKWRFTATFYIHVTSMSRILNGDLQRHSTYM